MPLSRCPSSTGWRLTATRTLPEALSLNLLILLTLYLSAATSLPSAHVAAPTSNTALASPVKGKLKAAAGGSQWGTGNHGRVRAATSSNNTISSFTLPQSCLSSLSFEPGATDPSPLSPSCAAVKLFNFSSLIPTDFFGQHAIVPAVPYAKGTFAPDGSVSLVYLQAATLADTLSNQPASSAGHKLQQRGRRAASAGASGSSSGTQRGLSARLYRGSTTRSSQHHATSDSSGVSGTAYKLQYGRAVTLRALKASRAFPAYTLGQLSEPGWEDTVGECH